MSIAPGTTSRDWDTAAVRRAMRVLCAQPPDIRNEQATARGLRLVWDILQRRGVRADVYQIPGIMPLIVVGNGPLLLTTYLDDQSPLSNDGAAPHPSVTGDIATGAGVTRRAGLLAAIGPIASQELTPDDVTLVIEADRHLGSIAIHSWLAASDRMFSYALWEATDLPVNAPAVFRSSTGTVTLSVSVQIEAGDIESLYAGVLPDAGHRLVETLAGLKSRDSEVLVPGFYDGIDTPDEGGLASLAAISDAVHEWVARGSGPSESEQHLSASHITLGVFCAPSILIRSIDVSDARPFVPRRAHAVIEARLMPGQDAHAIVAGITDHLHRKLPDAVIEPLLVRQPYNGSWRDTSGIDPIVTVYPTAAGDSPAGIFGTHGIPSLGFATVARTRPGSEERASISSIAAASNLIVSLSRQTNSILGRRH